MSNHTATTVASRALIRYSRVSQDRGAADAVMNTWPDIVQALTRPVAINCPDWADKASRNAAKAMAGGWCGATFTEGKRDRDHATTSQLAALDLDDITTPTLVRLWDRLGAEGWQFAAATTFSHMAPGAGPRWRVVVLLDRPVAEGDYATVVRTIAHKLGVTDAMDDGSHQLERIMYLPAHATGQPHDSQAGGAAPASVDLLLTEAADLGIRLGRVEAARKERPGVVGLPIASYRVTERLASIASEAQQALQLPEGKALDVQRGAETKAWGWEALANAWAYSIAGLTVTPTRTADGTLNPPISVEEARALWAAWVPVEIRNAESAPENGRAYLLDEKLDRHLAAPVAWDHHWSDVTPQDFNLAPPAAAEPAIDPETGEVLTDPWDVLFSATPTLQTIRQAAEARLAPPAGVLAFTLGRVLLATPPAVKLPPTIGGAAPLNLAFAMVGNSGAGKSMLEAVSGEVLGYRLGNLPGDPQEGKIRNVGSGEGLTKSFLQKKAAEDGSRAEWVLADDPAWFYWVPEVEQLSATMKRSGATIGPVIRSAISGETLSQTNAEDDRNRYVPGGRYRCVVAVGVQPQLAGPILDGENSGFPQRFVWVPTSSGHVPDAEPDWPGSLSWSLPAMPRDGMIHYPAHVADEVRSTRREQLRGNVPAEQGHLMLTRLKTAAALALLHQEVVITDRWWDLAGILINGSVVQMERCRQAVASTHDQQARAQGKRQAIIEEVRAEHASDRVLKAAGLAWAAVEKHADGSAHDGACTQRCVTRALQKYRDVRDDALEYVREADWLVRGSEERARDGRGSITVEVWQLGASRPA